MEQRLKESSAPLVDTLENDGCSNGCATATESAYFFSLATSGGRNGSELSR